MRIFVTHWFDKYVRKERIPVTRVCEAAIRAQSGLIDADLGGGLIKQRIARQGKGRSGGFRTLIALRRGDRAIFIYGFAKNERDNIGPDDLEDLKRTAGILLGLGEGALANAVAAGELKEVNDDV